MNEGTSPPRRSVFSLGWTRIASLFRRDVPDGRSLDGSLILGVSAWLILNSHLEHFYPWPWMAADGLLGNALFFWASGYGIQSSLQSRRQDLAPYMRRRLARIYPQTLLVILAFIAVSSEWRPQHGVQDIFSLFFWPTPYTYIRMIVPFYLLLWVVDRLGPWALATSVAAAIAVYGYLFAAHHGDSGQAHGLVLGELPDLMWWAYFWMAAALGAAMARRPLTSRITAWRLAGLASLLVFYFGIKLALTLTGGHAGWFPLLHVAVLLACAGFAMTLCSPETVRWAMTRPIIGPFLALSANLTLELYLVHAPLASARGLYSMPFPLNILLIATLALSGAVALRFLVDAMGGLVRAAAPIGSRPSQ